MSQLLKRRRVSALQRKLLDIIYIVHLLCVTGANTADPYRKHGFPGTTGLSPKQPEVAEPGRETQFNGTLIVCAAEGFFLWITIDDIEVGRNITEPDIGEEFKTRPDGQTDGDIAHTGRDAGIRGHGVIDKELDIALSGTDREFLEVSISGEIAGTGCGRHSAVKFDQLNIAGAGRDIDGSMETIQFDITCTGCDFRISGQSSACDITCTGCDNEFDIVGHMDTYLDIGILLPELQPGNPRSIRANIYPGLTILWLKEFRQDFVKCPVSCILIVRRDIHKDIHGDNTCFRRNQLDIPGVGLNHNFGGILEWKLVPEDFLIIGGI